MLYLDTSAFLKLYLQEDGTADVHGLVAAQDDPLPIWYLTEIEFTNALRFKVFARELTAAAVGDLVARFGDHKARGVFFSPVLSPILLQDLSLRMSLRTPKLGCRALDILHVAAARLCGAGTFVTADRRQAALAEAEGFTIRLVA